MDITFTKLRYLVTVAQARSFSRAAALLHVSQPALSRSITAIEDAYGVRIFERSHTGVMPTFAGGQIVAEAEQLLRNANTFDHNFRNIAKGEGGNLSFGIGPTLANPILGRLARDLMDRNSGIYLRAAIRSTNVLIDYLLAETIEVFMSPPEHVSIPSELSTERIGFVLGGFFARKDHPLSKKANFQLKDIFEYPYALGRDSILHERFSQNGNVFVCENDTVLFDLVETTDTICVSTHQSAAQWLESGRLTELRPLDFQFKPSEIQAVTIEGRTMSPLAREVVDICRTCLADS